MSRLILMPPKSACGLPPMALFSRKNAAAMTREAGMWLTAYCLLIVGFLESFIAIWTSVVSYASCAATMPVSHLGLNVSHIPSATSFYLSALQPLGYHYVGQQGDAIGLGIGDADLFLCQVMDGSKVSPTHIAFAAESRVIVRECYTAALEAGGRPSGPPGYRNNDCSCFNAAVEDQDGNTVEFIFREPLKSVGHKSVAPSSEYTQPPKAPTSVPRDDIAARREQFASFASKAQSTAQTALDIASTASKTFKNSQAPTTGIKRSTTDPITNIDGGSKALVGTLLGAAAGAAFAYAMVKSERDSSSDDSRSGYSRNGRSKASRRPHQDSITSARDARHQPRSMPAIEGPKHHDRDLEDILSQQRSGRRPSPQRSMTYDASEYRPRASSIGHHERSAFKRSSTMPLDQQDAYQGSGRSTMSNRSSRRRSIDDNDLKRHDSAVSVRSHRSRGSSGGKTSTVKPTTTQYRYESAANAPLPPSRGTSYGPGSQQSQGQTYVTAAKVPLPQSRATSYRSEIDEAEESDGLDDCDTLTPDDSISCVGISKPDKSSRSGRSKTSQYSSRRSEAESERTVKPAQSYGASRDGARTLPMRSKDEYYTSKVGRRSAATQG